MTRQFQTQADLLQHVDADAATKLLVGGLVWQLYQTSVPLAVAFDAMVAAARSLHVGMNATTEGFINADVSILRSQEHVVGVPLYSINVNLDQLSNNWFIATDGTLHKESLLRALGHELWHTLTGHTDPVASYIARSFPNQGFTADLQGARDWLGTSAADFVGDTVSFENSLGTALGGADSWQRAGYFSDISFPSSVAFDNIANSGRSLSEANIVANVFSDYLEGGVIDFHLKLGIGLVLGNGGEDKIIGTQGSDYLYGGIDNDYFYANTGFDFIHGGDLDRLHFTDGTDTVDYSKWESLTAKNTGTINVVLAPGQPTAFGATATADVIQVIKSQGGTDRLVSIEKIVGTDGNDQATVTGGMKIDNSLTLDFGGGFNTLTYNGSTPSQIQAPLQYLYHTKLEDGTPTGRSLVEKQLINIQSTSVDKVLLLNSLIFVDGHQLVGGSSFKLNYGDYTTTANAQNLFPVPTVVTYTEGLAYKAQASLLYPLSGAGANVWDTVLYSDQGTSRTVGVWGEFYDFSNGTYFDTPGTLTITIRDAIDYKVKLTNWKNGDFGISLTNYNLETSTNDNGRSDDWYDLNLNDVAVQLSAAGFDQFTYSDPASGSQDGLQRNGSASNDVLIGTAQADTFRSAAGNDTLTGGDGNDTYYFRYGDGVDVISETATGQNTIEFAPSVTQISQARVVGNDIVIDYGTQGDSVHILNTQDLSRWAVLGLTHPALTNPAPTTTALSSSTVLENSASNTVVGTLTTASGYAVGPFTYELLGGDGSFKIVGNQVLVDDPLKVDYEKWNAVSRLDVAITDSNGAYREQTISIILQDVVGETVTGDGLDNEIWGNIGADTLSGGAGIDVLRGGAGNDVLSGGAGFDWILGGDGNDVIYAFGGTGSGGAGDYDDLQGEAGNDIIYLNGTMGFASGGTGDDRYYVYRADQLWAVTEFAGEGTDEVVALFSSATITDGIENLTLSTGGIYGEGNDAANVLRGNTAANTLGGNAGADTLYGGAGADVLIGGYVGSYNDISADVMRGEDGNDTYYVDNADTVVETSLTDIDTVRLAMVDPRTVYTLGANLENLEFADLNGYSNVDRLNGNAANNVIKGSNLANTLDGMAGNDTLYGYGGNDTYIVDSAADQIVETTGAGTDRVQTSVSYTLGAGDSIEALETTSAAGATALGLYGNEIAQTITGNAGLNIIDGKLGIDTLTGGAGNDYFVFSTALSGNRDQINDFNSAADTIRLDQTIFTKLTVVGALNAAYFKAGAPADANDYILYNSSTGMLSYDVDGNGAQAAVQFAYLNNKPATLTAADFYVLA